MADLNALIAQGFQFKAPPDPFEQYGKMQQLEQGRQANQLNVMKLDEARRGVEEANQLRSLDPTAADYLAQVSQINPKTGFELGKLQRDAETAKLSKKKFVQQAQRDTSRNPSDANITAFKEDLLANPDFTDQEKAQLAAGADRLLSMPIGERQAFMASQGASAGELKPTLTTQNLGGSTQMLSTPAFGGQAGVVPGSVQQMSMTPGQAQANQIAEARLAQGDRRLAGIENRATAAAGIGTALAPKEVQKREAKYPQATAAVRETLSAQDQLIKDLEALKKHSGLKGITGVIFGRTPSVAEDSREAKAKFDKIMARGGFSELAKMRAASPTGGALGNVSDTEGKYLRQAFAALDPTQSTESFQKTIDEAIAELQGSKERVQDAYDMTYEYRQPQAAATKPADGWGKAVAK